MFFAKTGTALCMDTDLNSIPDSELTPFRRDARDVYNRSVPIWNNSSSMLRLTGYAAFFLKTDNIPTTALAARTTTGKQAYDDDIALVATKLPLWKEIAYGL